MLNRGEVVPAVGLVACLSAWITTPQMRCISGGGGGNQDLAGGEEEDGMSPHLSWRRERSHTFKMTAKALDERSK